MATERDYFFENSFIGAGWSFNPLRGGLGVDGNGNVGLMQGDQDVAKSIFIILSTAPGERVMRTEFGCGIHDLVFATANPQTFAMISYEVKQALGRWEPRIEVTDVKVAPDQDYPERLIIDINYRLVKTNNERNLVYPFYIIPRNEE
jgi:phage baseplate assembly protein W